MWRCSCSLVLATLACARFDEPMPMHADGRRTVLVITTELDASVRDELGTALSDRAEYGGYAVAARIDDEGLQVLSGCTVPVVYEWQEASGSDEPEQYDSSDALFVTAEPDREGRFVALDHEASVRFRTQRRAVLPDVGLVTPFEVDACEPATHVIREVLFGSIESDDEQILLGLWVAPLPSDEQLRWEWRQHRGEAVGEVALGVLSAALLAGVAALCLSDLEHCTPLSEPNETSNRSRPLRSHATELEPPVSTFPSHGAELGRSPRMQVETGPGGFVLRF